MAADLEIRAPLTVKIHSDHRPPTTDDTPNQSSLQIINQEQQQQQQQADHDHEEEDCHTPRSPDHMIPAALSCPPAPKKPRFAASSCKRRLFDLPFFEKAARDEVEALFGSTVVQVNLNGSVKRKCIA